MKNSGGGGERVVQGGQILFTSQKDRQSKVYTSKGPRDRRVRLSAHTAIQFYDVQDRLGYDRASKALDWLIKKAKNAIDKLTESPPGNHHETTLAHSGDHYIAAASEMAFRHHSESSSEYAFKINDQLGENPGSCSSILSPLLDIQTTPSSIKSLFPTSSGASSMNFHDYPRDIVTRIKTQTQELCLSLHSIHDPSSGQAYLTDQTLFLGSAFDANYPRLVACHDGGSAETRERYNFSPELISQPPFPCQSSELWQRRPLQSSFSHLRHAWDDKIIASPEHHTTETVQESSISSSQFALQGLSQFHVPPLIQSEVQHPAASNKPYSTSTDYHL